MQHATTADPSNPDVAWDAANFYWSMGETDEALREFRIVLENDSYLPPAALAACWRIKPDVKFLLQNVVPRNPDTYSIFLDFFISKNEPDAAATVWNQIVELHQRVDRRYVFEYVRYLISGRQVGQALRVWGQSADLCDLSEYQPSPENRVVNGDFSSPVLNGGFDWTYEKSPDVSLALDPTESHAGHRSLSIVFDSHGIEDAGIRQLIPVEPSTKYEFSAYFKSQAIEGAGGPRFVLEDQFNGTNYFASDELKDADVWKQVEGTFSTGVQIRNCWCFEFSEYLPETRFGGNCGLRICASRRTPLLSSRSSQVPSDFFCAGSAEERVELEPNRLPVHFWIEFAYMGWLRFCCSARWLLARSNHGRFRSWR